MSASIKITANTGDFKKALLDLSTYSKRTLGKSAISLFDKNTKEILTGQADATLQKLQKRSERLKEIISDYGKKVKASTGDARKELEYRERLIQATQRLVSVEKDRAQLQESSKNLRQTSLGQMSEGLKDSAKSIPWLGKLLGISSMGALGLAAGGAAIGAGVYGYSRMATGYGVYKAGLPSRIRLMGRGARDLTMNPELRGAFGAAGMNEEDVRQARLQSMDALGAAGATQNAVLARAQFARNFGLDVGEVTALGGGLRAQTSSAAANRDLMKLQASLIASGIKDTIGPYLETAASMLTDIRSHGLVDSGQVLSLFSALTKGTGNSPEQIAQHVSGLQGAVQQSSGEANAFYQQAFAAAGIGGHTIGGIQAAIKSGGIFGVGAGDMQGMSASHIAQFQKLGLIQGADGRGGVRDRLSAITGQLDRQFNTSRPEGLLAQGRFMNSMGIGSNPLEAVKIMDEMRSALKSGNLGAMSRAEKKLQDASKSPQDRMLDNLGAIQKSGENQLVALEKIRDDQLEFMGKQAAPAAMLMSKTLLHIDEVISALFGGAAKLLGGDHMANVQSGAAAMTDEDVQEIRARGKAAVVKAGQPLTTRSIDLGAEIAKDRASQAEAVKRGDSTTANYYAGQIVDLQKQLKTVNDSLAKLIGVQTSHLEVSKSIDATGKRNAKAKPKSVVNDSASQK